MTSRALVLITVAMLTAGTASAQNQRRDRARDDASATWERDGFASMDRNQDGRISRDEWRLAFDERDDNNDGQLSPREFTATAAQRDRSARRDGAGRRSNTFWAGYDRGQQEGHAAGRDDRERNQGWDLEGQRELETADSGYTPAAGPREEYQAGYREGFRLAYRQAFGR